MSRACNQKIPLAKFGVSHVQYLFKVLPNRVQLLYSVLDDLVCISNTDVGQSAMFETENLYFCKTMFDLYKDSKPGCLN